MSTAPPSAAASADTDEPIAPPTDRPAARRTTSVSPDGAAIWRAVRMPLLLAALVLIVVAGTVLITGGRERGDLDPRAADPSGSRALAELLRRQGIDVTLVTDTTALLTAVEQTPDTTTVVVPFPERLTDAQLGAVGVLRPARTVLIAPESAALEAFGVDASDSGTVSTGVLQPRCTLPEAERAGSVNLGGRGYISNAQGAVRCYPQEGQPTLAVVPRESGDVVLFGTGNPLRNRDLDEQGNASLSMQLLGGHPTVLWYLPSNAEDGGQEGLLHLLPAGWRFGILQFGIAVVLFALYRARRLGPVVTEPLPVVVRATETAEGRARLYRRGRTAGHAAEELRAAARARIAARLGVPSAAAPTALADAAAARTGRPAADIHDLLYGAVPIGDDGLIALADRLDLLEEHVKTGEPQP
ncbi:DUF4350 domain-containing protein [Yinghuangia aomiensis]|uniref:DUF4350 domain-containing protein n=1 Tax=Yinghuangia aomiensis TaxID=676205 RepID=A0ABP9I8L6_9ACTN